MKNDENKENDIKLIKVLPDIDAEVFLAKYPGKRRNVRFNTSWWDKDPSGKRVYQDFVKMYKGRDKDFEPWILSDGTNKKRLKTDDIVFQFIKINEFQNKWLFVGAYLICDLDRKGVNKVTTEKFMYATAKRLTEFDLFSDRLIVEKPVNRSFVYTGPEIIDSIKVSSILEQPYLSKVEQFPGYENVCKDYKSLEQCIEQPAWRDALKSVYGVYLLTDTKTGKQYVGSATGTDGIYGRWSTYLKNGYETNEKEYPNKRLKELVKKETIKYIKENFQYAILEIFSKNDHGRNKALERESYWKDVLKTREFGYNDN